MNRLFALVLVVALAAGAVAAYNFFVFEVAQPFPLSWNHSDDELRLVELERERRALATRLGAGQRAMSLAGVPHVGAPDAREGGARPARRGDRGPARPNRVRVPLSRATVGARLP